jgi:hypothetical protein
MNKDQKGDLVEKLIFEAYKRRYIRNAEAFKQYIKREYGLDVTSDLYRKIVNFQVEEYGETLSDDKQREYIKYFHQKESLQRVHRKRLNIEKEKEKRRIERIEKNKRTIKKKNT